MSLADDYTAKLAKEGTFDSSGVMTLDRVAQNRKLALFLIAEPWLYLLKLLQAAQSLETGTVQLKIDRTHLGIWFELPPGLIVPDEFWPLFHKERNSHEHLPRWKSHLCSGIELSLAALGRWHQVTIGTGQHSQWMKVTDKQVEFGCEECEAGSEPAYFHFHLEFVHNPWWKIWLDITLAREIRAFLQRRFSRSRLKVYVNKEALHPDTFESIPGYHRSLEARIKNEMGANLHYHWVTEWIWLPAASDTVQPDPNLTWSEPLTRRAAYYSFQATDLQPLDPIDGWSASDHLGPINVNQVLYGLYYNVRFQLTSVATKFVGPSGNQLIEQTVESASVGDLQRMNQQGVGPIAQEKRAVEEFRTAALAGRSQWCNEHFSNLMRAGRVSLLSIVPSGPARLQFIYDGALLNEVVIEDGVPGSVAVVATETLETDPSQLNPILDSATVQSAIAWAKQTWQEQLHELKTHIFDTRYCESAGIPLLARQEWRQYLNSR